MTVVTPETLLTAYANGYFPMAKSRDDPQIFWFYPEMRGILPLDAFHIPKSLAKFISKKPFEITFNQAFPEVIAACAGRQETWINDAIIALYCRLWEMGFTLSCECWQGGKLVGGIYGVAIGGAFFGESMFSQVPNASKVALAHLVEWLKNAGFQLFDTQYVNDHIRQFGVVEIPRAQYLALLAKAIEADSFTID